MLHQNIIYALIDPRTNKIRYIGKSTYGLDRPREHTKPSLLQAETHKNHWIKKLLSLGLKPGIEILAVAFDADILTKLEIDLIALYRKAGFKLTNGTDGGEGAIGRIVKTSTKNLMRKIRLEYWSKPENVFIPANKKQHILIDGIKYKHCPKCEKDKLLNEFSSNKSRWDGLTTYCTPCHNTKINENRRRKKNDA